MTSVTRAHKLLHIKLYKASNINETRYIVYNGVVHEIRYKIYNVSHMISTKFIMGIYMRPDTKFIIYMRLGTWLLM